METTNDLNKYKNEIIKLQQQIETLELENKRLNEIINKSNRRGAGRKKRFTEHEEEMIKMYRLQNKTIREIAEMFNCSDGLVHSIINK